MTVPPPRAPRYGSASLGELLPAAVAAITGGESALLPWPAGLRAVVVVVIDGLGRRQLAAHAALAPFLTAATGTTLDAPFPSSTATSLTSLGTGRPPGEHGLTGLAIRPPGHDRRLVTLTWSWDRQLPVTDARNDVVPEELQSQPTVFERSRSAGVTPVTVLAPEFIGSGLTRAALRGGDLVTAAGLDASLQAALTAAATRGPALVYVHHGAVDAAGHADGPGSAAWCTEVAAVDAAVERLAVALPADTAVVVTADHGMVATPPDEAVELRDDPDLLRGVALLAGEPRCRHLHTAPGAAADVAAAWREVTGGAAHVATRDEAVAAGWFGPTVRPRVHGSIGDVVVVAADAGRAWVHADLDSFGGRLRGQHGALTRDEVEIPALLVTRSG